jgi:DNA polymerase (family 10)
MQILNHAPNRRVSCWKTALAELGEETMAIHNAQIAALFNELADLLEIEGANPFRIRAYRNASRVIGNWPRSLAEANQEEGKIPKLPGIGADLSQKVAEISSTGNLKALNEIRGRVPREILQLIKIPGVGPKRAKLLFEERGIRSTRELERAAKQGKIRNIPGFGEKVEQNILQGLRARSEGMEKLQARIKYAEAEQIIAPLMKYLRKAKELDQAEIAGSYRRKQETVGDLDIVSTCEKPESLIEHFIQYGEVARVLSQGTTRSTVLFRSGVQVDLRVVEKDSYGAALHYFTGSKAHNIAIRKLALKKGLKINEYGVFKGERRVAGKTEAEVYAKVGLPYIEPELRENRGEIEAAQEGRLPNLITLDKIRGDLHAHTNATDGRSDLETMAKAAQAQGYEYLAITDHTQRLTMAHGQDPKRVRAQIKKIDKLNEKLKGIRILKAAEVDILEDGRLDLPDDVLRELDFTVCSVHSKFNLSLDRQTQRVIRAMDNPYFTVFGHPSGRLIQQREPYEIDLEAIMMAARDRGCFLEVNAQPDRMDLTDVYCRMAKEIGVCVAISSDSHSDNDILNMKYGVGQARRGWIEVDDVINTRSLKQLLKLFNR